MIHIGIYLFYSSFGGSLIFLSSLSLISMTSYKKFLFVYTHISDAISIDFLATSSALSSGISWRALAAAIANGLPLPTANTLSWLSNTSPFPYKLKNQHILYYYYYYIHVIENIFPLLSKCKKKKNISTYCNFKWNIFISYK